LPQDWAATQNNLGIALRRLADRSAGPQGEQLLREAIEAYRSALSVRTRERLPQGWAATQNNLGIALNRLAVRSSGLRVVEFLDEAVEAFCSAISVPAHPETFRDRSTVHNNLCIVIFSYFVNYEFRALLRQLDRLRRENALQSDVQLAFLVAVLRVACYSALG